MHHTLPSRRTARPSRRTSVRTVLSTPAAAELPLVAAPTCSTSTGRATAPVVVYRDGRLEHPATRRTAPVTQLLDPPTSDSTADRGVETAGSQAPPVAWRSFRGQREPRFAGLAERECAELLDQHAIGWEHQPITFVLETGEDGRVAEVFRPDFYLPDLNLFLEVAPAGREQAAHADRLVRKLRRRHPDVNVRLFARHDVELLARRQRSRGRAAHAATNAVPDDALLVS